MLAPRAAFLAGAILLVASGDAREPGSFTDTRDGQVYDTVAIGEQVWMAENLNFETPESWCYAESAEQCDRYGRLYTWESAKKACPRGWHLPSEEEWRTLERHLGMTAEETEIFLMRGEGTGTKLKNAEAWEADAGTRAGYDTVGFNALPGGFRLFLDGSFKEEGVRGAWWSRTPSGRYALRRALFLNESGIDRDPATRANGFSVRCVGGEGPGARGLTSAPRR